MASRPDAASTVAQLRDHCAENHIAWSDANGILSKKRLLENIRCAVKKRPSAQMLRAEAGIQCKVRVGPDRVHLPQEMLFLLSRAPRPLTLRARDLDVLDFMTSASEVSKAARRLHMRAETFGIELDAREDILTEQGLKLAWRKLKRVRRKGLFVVQPPCKRWLCYVSRALSERSFNDDAHAGRALRGAGNTDDEETRMANRTAPVVASLMWWALEHDIEVISEQPLGSLLGQYTPYRCVLASMERHKVDGCMYGWSSQKPFWLYLSKGLRADSLKKCNHIGRHALQLMVDGHGEPAMSDSSRYTPAFARALLRTWR